MLILAFILSFFPVVFFHELGHFVVGFYLKAKPSQFTLGVGPVILKKTYKGILFSWNLFPIGGYVIFNTTQFSELEPTKEKLHPSRWLFISLAGPLSNFIVSYIIFFSMALLLLNSYEIQKISSQNSIYNNNFLISNSRVKVNAESFKNKYKNYFIKNGNEIIDQDNNKIDYEGFNKTTTLGEIKRIDFFTTVKLSALRSYDIMVTYFSETSKAFMNLFKGEGDFSGPLGIAQKADETLSSGYISFFIFIASLSFALGFFNLLPIMLALDGGRALAALVEVLMRKPLPKKTLIKLYQVSWLGIFLILFISLSNDLKNIFNF
jgi:regulator of sigma E protease